MKWSRFSTHSQTWWRDEELRFQIRHRREDDVYVLHDHERGSRVSFWPSLREAQREAIRLVDGDVSEDDVSDATREQRPIGVALGRDGVPALGDLHPFRRHPHLAWRYDALVLDGFSFEDAERLALATDDEGEPIDYRRLSALVADGCDLDLAEAIVR